jgi:hypothetical protein
LILRVPEEESEVLQLADHLAIGGDLEFKTESNGKGLPKMLRPGTSFINAVNEEAMDGGGIAEEVRTRDPVLILSQSKFTLDYVPQSGADGGDVNLTRGAAEAILKGLRTQAEVLRGKLGYGANQRIHFVYDVFTTRQIGARLQKCGESICAERDGSCPIDYQRLCGKGSGPHPKRAYVVSR